MKKKITAENLKLLLNNQISKGKDVYAPVLLNNITEFQKIQDADQIKYDCFLTVSSPKFTVFPKVEKLFTYKKDIKGVTLNDVEPDQNEFILFGAHPCDAAGIDVLKAVFKWDTVDEHFMKRYNNMTVIGLACTTADDKCFCTSVDLSPSHHRGSDLFLTPLDDKNYIAESVTTKGEQLMNENENLFSELNGNEKEQVVEIPVKFDLQKVKEKLDVNFENEIWEALAMRCMGCGACTYVCPTCSCYDIQDEGKLNCGVRYRCWDTCGISHFTTHTSGHNPREKQNQRWRQRVMHKFSYQPERLKINGCVGCGRCVRACPVNLSISDTIISILEAK